MINDSVQQIALYETELETSSEGVNYEYFGYQGKTVCSEIFPLLYDVRSPRLVLRGVSRNCGVSMGLLQQRRSLRTVLSGLRSGRAGVFGMLRRTDEEER